MVIFLAFMLLLFLASVVIAVPLSLIIMAVRSYRARVAKQYTGVVIDWRHHPVTNAQWNELKDIRSRFQAINKETHDKRAARHAR